MMIDCKSPAFYAVLSDNSVPATFDAATAENLAAEEAAKKAASKAEKSDAKKKKKGKKGKEGTDDNNDAAAQTESQTDDGGYSEVCLFEEVF